MTRLRVTVNDALFQTIIFKPSRGIMVAKNSRHTHVMPSESC